MEKAKKMSATQNKVLYLLFCLSATLLAIFADNISWAGIFLALGVVFIPFNDKPFPELSLHQKALIVGQILVAMVLIGINMHLTIGN
jgi:hypothetical protein